jgi:hypothetical protein
VTLSLPTWTRARSGFLIAALALFVGVNLFNALTKGGDFTVFLESGRRMLHAEPLYEDSRVAEGVIGPPFQAVFFAPFAWIAESSEVASRVAWYAVNLLALLAAVLWWQRALAPSTREQPEALAASWRERVTSPQVLLALLAVSHSLQANFQHQNLSVLLLAAVGAAAAASRAGQDRATGALVGFATAMKAFPGLLLIYLLVRGRGRALAWGVATTVALTAAPVLWYGPRGWTAMLQDWLALSGSGGWPIRSHNQSLFAMIGRWLGPEGITATGALSAIESPAAYVVWAACVVGLLGFCGFCLLRGRCAWQASAAEDMAIGLGLAVLISPIAWDHYWLLFFPAFHLVLISRSRLPGPLLGRTFWTAAVLISGAALLGRQAWRISRWLSVKSIGGLLLVVVLSLAIMWWRQRDAGRADDA